jgi:hypothetical protein
MLILAMYSTNLLLILKNRTQRGPGIYPARADVLGIFMLDWD